jgi:hypothetical protein
MDNIMQAEGEGGYFGIDMPALSFGAQWSDQHHAEGMCMQGKGDQNSYWGGWASIGSPAIGVFGGPTECAVIAFAGPLTR